MTTVPAPVMSHPVDQDRGEVRQPGPEIPLETVLLAVANMTYLAERHVAEGWPEPEPGPNYQPEYRQFCQRCNLPRHPQPCR